MADSPGGAGGRAAALADALAYVAGFVVIATLLDPGNTWSRSETQQLAFSLDRKAGLQVWTISVCAVFRVVLVVLGGGPGSSMIQQ